MEKFEAGDKVEYMYHGEWTGPYWVSTLQGETPDHIVLRGPDGNLFQVYNDSPFNVRKVES